MYLRIIYAIFILAMFSGRSFALNSVTYQSVARGGTFSAVANLNGIASSTKTVDISNPGAIGTVLYSSQNYYQSLQTSLNAAFVEAAAGVTEASVSVRYISGILAGTMNISIAGLPSGNLKLDVSGLSYSTDLVARDSFGPINVSCSIHVTLRAMSFSLVYNPFTGVVSDAVPTFGMEQVSSCNTSLSFIPFIGDAINRYIEKEIGKLTANFGGVSGKLLDVAPQRALFGFLDAIQPNAYMAGNVDVGMYLKNNIQNLYMTKAIKITIPAPASFFVPTYGNVAGPRVKTGPGLSIDFLDADAVLAGFKVIVTRYYDWIPLGEE